MENKTIVLQDISKLVIDRATWRHGGRKTNSTFSESDLTEKFGNTELVNTKGFKCCLGFYCEQIGFPVDLLLGTPTPGRLKTMVHRFGYKLENIESFNKLFKRTDDVDYPMEGFSTLAIGINDKPYSKLSKKEREENIKNLFKEIGVEVEFVGEYPEIK